MNTMKPLLLAAMLLGVAAPTLRAQNAHLGFRGGYNFDREDALIGAHMTFPVGGLVDLYPSIDYYFTDGSGSMVGFNVDLKLREIGRQSVVYVGGGLSMLRSSNGGVTDTDTGGNLFAGLESRMGSTHPFLEVRGLLREQSSVQIVGGLNFTLH
jgi:hypothetical protein